MTRLIALVLLAVAVAAGISVVHSAGRDSGRTSISSDGTTGTNTTHEVCSNCV